MQSDRTNRMLVDSVHLEFGRRTILRSAYITAETGKVTGLLGRNGSGKSCLFKCIMGGITPGNMFIRFNEETDTDLRHIGRRVKYLPQDTLIPGYMTLKEAFNLYETDYDGLVSFDTAFHRYHGKHVGELSGGEARIAETYLILNSKAEFCILDEPFSNIAPVHAQKIQSLIQEKKSGKGIIVSDHLYKTIVETADCLFLLSEGYTFQINSAEDLKRHGYIH